ncbi:hypothetical protein Acy02nite_89430 [Actinoplanes cyaneus]|uniref:Uncharacterized protein n=1 Tax=Actinoplanes cyaneus TaxID=52696 RepID=A0A919M9P1_9ACTN|nr:hypothetical protein [Actinoplanes cyaneus]GID71062.1 hypothetical protein Acy02nite_89430 [Actinoplanes cyaneus]
MIACSSREAGDGSKTETGPQVVEQIHRHLGDAPSPNQTTVDKTVKPKRTTGDLPGTDLTAY